MKTKTIYTRAIALILSVVGILALAACQSTSETVIDSTEAPNIVETIPSAVETPDAVESTPAESTIPEIIEVPSPDLNPLFYGMPTTPEDELKKYGEIETLVKSLVKAPKITNDPAKVNKTQYGTVDWNTASKGYVTFTAIGPNRMFHIHGPNGVKIITDVKNGETIKIALVDGTGKYQYGIGARINGGYVISYKNSFTIDSFDTDLSAYLISTPWGDFENAPNASKQASELWNDNKTQLENVKAIAEWVDHTLTYDKKLKQGECSVYVNPDSVIKNKGGVCNEFSKLLSAMLRSQGVPAYYQMGEGAVEGSDSHAWVRAWVELENYEKDGKIYSKGAWIAIEATDASIDSKNGDSFHDVTDTTNYAN